MDAPRRAATPNSPRVGPGAAAAGQSALGVWPGDRQLLLLPRPCTEALAINRGGRQQSAEAMQEAIAAADQEEEAARQQQQPHTPSRRDKRSTAQVKPELSRSPLPPSGAQPPLTDGSNRACSPPRHQTNAARVTPLTQSSSKAPMPASSQPSARSVGAAPSTPSRAGIIPRERASPSRSPARGRSSTASPARERLPPGSPRSGGSAASSAAVSSSLAEDWFVFPIVSPEALRDLLGDETSAESLAVLDSRKIQVKVEKPTGGAAAAGAADGQGFPKLLGRVQRNCTVGSCRRLLHRTARVGLSCVCSSVFRVPHVL